MARRMILRAFFAALGQMTDARFRGVFLTGIALTLGVLIGASAGVVWLAGWLVGDAVTLPFLGEVAWVDDLVSWGAIPLVAILSIFLMIPVASAVTSMFLDRVAQAVEDEHFPHLPAATPVPFADALRDTLGFLGVLIGANLLALILYLLLAPAAPLIFWGLNGFLLGREYFTLVAMRRVGRDQAKVLRSRNSVTIWIAGVLMAIPLSVPVLNLFIPILGAATFTHLFHSMTRPERPGQTSPDR